MAALNYTKLTANRLYEVTTCLPETYYGYVYMTLIVDRGAYYIGQHKGKFNPAYIDYTGSGTRLLRYIAKNGKSNIYVMCLGTAQTKEGLDALEKQFVGDKYKTDPNCWNLKAGGDTPGYSLETRAKIAKSLTGKKHSAETRAKLSASWDYDKHISPERNAKISQYLRAHKRAAPVFTEEQQENLRQKAILNNSLLTEEEKKRRSAKLSASLKGHKSCTKGFHWYTNGSKSVLAASCPEGFYLGRASRRK